MTNLVLTFDRKFPKIYVRRRLYVRVIIRKLTARVMCFSLIGIWLTLILLMLCHRDVNICKNWTCLGAAASLPTFRQKYFASKHMTGLRSRYTGVNLRCESVIMLFFLFLP